MSWIPFTTSCKSQVDGRRCSGWWWSFKSQDRCPKCNAAVVPVVAAAPPMEVWSLPPGALAMRIPFSLGERDHREFRLDRSLIGFVDLPRESVGIKHGQPFGRTNIRGLMANLSDRPTGRELFQELRSDRTQVEVRGTAYLLTCLPFDLHVQCRPDAISRDHMAVKAFLDLEVKVVSPERFADHFMTGGSVASTDLPQMLVDSARINEALSGAFGLMLTSELRNRSGEEIHRGLLETNIPAGLRADITAYLDARGLSLCGMRGIEGYAEDVQRQIDAKVKVRARGVDVGIHVETTSATADAINAIRPAKDGLAAADRAEREAQYERDRKQRKIDDKAGVQSGLDEIENTNDHLELRNKAVLVQETRDIELGESTASSAERAEKLAERVRELERLIRERVSADEVHAFKTSENFERIVRDAEQQVGLDGLLKDGEIERLRADLENRLRHDQTMADISLRRVMRAHESEEAAHKRKLEAEQFDHERTMRLGQAKTDVEIGELTSMQQGRTEVETNRRKLDMLREMQEIEIRGHESSTDRKRREESGKNEDLIKVIGALQGAGVTITPEVSAMLLGQPAEVVMRVAAEFNAARDRAPAEKPQDSVAEREYLRGLVDKVVSELTSVAGKQADAARPVTQVIRESRANRKDA